MTATPRRAGRARKLAMRWVIIILCIYGLYLVVGLAIQRRMMFPTWIVPDYEVDTTTYPAAYETHTIDTPAGTTNYLYIPADRDEAGPLVVFAHGNAEIIDIWPPLLEPYLRMGVSVLIVEYRGYGQADGAPSQRAITADFAAALDEVIQRPEVDPNRLIYHGRSIGGGVACRLARQRKPAAIILQSTFTDTGAVAMRYGYLPWLMRDRFNNAAVLRRYDGPVLLLHGNRDGIITFGHSEKLHQLAPHSRLIEFDNVGHNDLPIESDEFWQTIGSFLRDAELVAEK